mgnify:CR=1 FL=1
MIGHAAHRMHENSLDAYGAERERLGRRAQAVLAWVHGHGPATDRDIMRGLGFTDPNTVRPRVTELVEWGLLAEIGRRVDSLTRKTVRVVDVPRGPQQMAMAI